MIEESLIGGVLHYRASSEGEWVPYTLEQLSGRYAAIRDDLSDYRRRLIAYNEEASNGTWRWVGDGSDHLESMTDDMLITIRAGDLRAALSRSAGEQSPALSGYLCIAKGDSGADSFTVLSDIDEVGLWLDHQVMGIGLGPAVQERAALVDPEQWHGCEWRFNYEGGPGFLVIRLPFQPVPSGIAGDLSFEKTLHAIGEDLPLKLAERSGRVTPPPGERSSPSVPTGGYLHIYAQDAWHDSAYVVGTREALEALRAAVGSALHGDRSAFCAFTGDGEGYTIHLGLTDSDTLGRMRMPYTDEHAVDERASAIQPWEVCEPQ